METSDAQDLGVLGHGYHDCTEVGRCILPLRSPLHMCVKIKPLVIMRTTCSAQVL